MSFNLKHVVVAIFLCSMPMGALSQIYSTGYQAGGVLKIVSSKLQINSDLVSTSETESEVGYQFGGFFRINIDRVVVQPELLYSKIQSQLVFNDYDGVQGFDPIAEFEFNTIELPVHFGYRIGNLRLTTGPTFSILVSGERSFLNQVQKITSEYNRTNLMWNIGVGGDFDRVFVDIKYESGLSKTGESLSNLIGREFIPKQRQWVFSVALNILRD